MYPRKVGKLAARKSWDRSRPTPELFEKMKTALAWQIAQWRDPQFIPYPATWLNQGRWDDEPLVRTSPARAAWSCPHLEPCAHRAMCETATILKRPVKAAS